ncbi:MAG: HU family DNA-binding protein [Candidatus Berkelbacteria bacterium]|nr:HU family DNA-binding protein [Candidatus Berkelbacteria bacterium]
MTKEKFAAQLAKEMRTLGFKINADNAEKLIIALSKSMVEGLTQDRKLIVSNFGSFEIIKYGAKMIKSPRGDNKEFFMPPTDVIKWHPSGKIRVRAGSEEVADEEYKKLIGHASYEIETPVIFDQKEEIASSPIDQTNPYEIKVNFIGKSTNHLTDNKSPISKFVKSIFFLMKTFDADKLEIIPGKSQTRLFYFAGNKQITERSLPKDSHSVIVQKIESLAGLSSELLLFGTDRIKLSRQLTQFGDQLIIQRV